MAEAHEFVDVELVVREQHEVLEVLGRGAGVVAQPVQRVVDPRRGEQRQRLRLAGAAARRCRWRCRRPSQPGRAGRTGRASAGAARGVSVPSMWSFSASEKCTGIGCVAGADFERHRWFFSSSRNCSQVVVLEQVGPRQRGLEGARAGRRSRSSGASRRAPRCRCARARTGKQARTRSPGTSPSTKAPAGLAQVVRRWRRRLRAPGPVRRRGRRSVAAR